MLDVFYDNGYEELTINPLLVRKICAEIVVKSSDDEVSDICDGVKIINESVKVICSRTLKLNFKKLAIEIRSQLILNS